MLLLPDKNRWTKISSRITSKKSYLLLLLTVMMSTVFTACKKWENRNAVTDAQLSKNLMDQISQDATLSTFSSYLVKTGYDKVIASSKTFTVWAPNNAAMQSVDQAILNDTTRLKQFVGNHIANQSYATSEPQTAIRIKILNGKNATFTRTTFEEANIVQANQYVGNGILHVIDKAIVPKLSIWEFLNSTSNTLGIKQKNYIQALNFSFTDTSKATQTGVDPVTGKPVLQPGTGVVNANTYLNTVLDISNEDQQYTYIIMADAAYDTERNKVARFFNTTGNYRTTVLDSVTFLSGFNVLKDMAFNRLIPPAEFTGDLLSVNNVRVPINRSAILQTYQASNGIVYVMNNVNFRLEDKITPIIIQGENPVGFSRNDRGGNIQYRIRRDPAGNNFNDILIASSAAGVLPALFTANYATPNLYSAPYKIYWRALNDTGVLFSQQLILLGSTSGYGSMFLPVNLNVYNEVLLNATTNYSVTRYGSQRMQMQGNNNTTTGMNSITFDYVKLVPVLQ